MHHAGDGNENSNTVYGQDVAVHEEPLSEVYFNPDYFIEEEIKKEIVKDKPIIREIIDVIGVRQNDEAKEDLEGVIITTDIESTIVDLRTVIEAPI